MTGKQSTAEKSKSASSSGNQKLVTKMPHMVTRLPISDLNQHLTCALCSGYLIDATTVVECLHSFCRSCLLRYLETSNTCPICDTQINKAQLDKCVRADHTLQDLVYKLVPGLYKNELRRRKEFYLEQCKSATDDASTSKSEGMQIFDKHLVELSAFICTPDEIVSFSLETVAKKSEQNESNGKSKEQYSMETRSTQSKNSKENAAKPEDLHFKRYFRCPAAVTVGHLKRLLAYKMELSTAHQIEILHSDEPLLDEYTLMDIAYIYTWRRKAPMQLFFNVCKYETEEEPMPLLEPEIATPVSSSTTSTLRSPTLIDSSSQDVKQDVTTAGSSCESRVPDLSVIPKKSWNLDSKKDFTSISGNPGTSNSRILNLSFSKLDKSPTKETPLTANSVKSVLELACRSSTSACPPASTETSMRGKPPLPIHYSDVAPISRPSNGFNQQKTMPNGRMPPLKLTLSASGIGKERKKSKNQSPSTPKIKKTSKTTTAAKVQMLTPSPDYVRAALQKIAGQAQVGTSLPVVQNSTIPVTSPVTVPLPIIVETSAPGSPLHSPTSLQQSQSSPLQESQSSPLQQSQSSPPAAYQPTAAQSACTQPAKLRLKKTLSSVVQELSSNALEACSPSKKMKLENGKEEHSTSPSSETSVLLT